MINPFHVRTYNLPEVLKPSEESLLGSQLSNLEAVYLFRAQQNDSCIKTVAIRVLLTLAAIFVSALDLVCWTMMTITIYPICKVGVLAHLTNLISHIAMPIFCLSLLFRCLPTATDRRKSFISLCKPGHTVTWLVVQHQPNVKELLRRVDTPQKKSEALMCAAGYGKKEIVEALLKEGNADPNCYGDRLIQRTPLFAAISGMLHGFYQDRNTVDVLLAHRANPNIPVHGLTPLIVGAGAGFDIEVTKLMQHRANPHVKGQKHLTAIAAAILGVVRFGVNGDYYSVKLTLSEKEMKEKNGNLDLKDRSIFAVKSIISQLIEKEVECTPRQLDDLTGLVSATNSKEPQEKIGNWLDAEDDIPEKQRSPFRKFLNLNRTRLDNEPIWFSRISANIVLLRPIVDEAKKGVIERRTTVIDETGFLQGIRPMAWIISEYCYA